LFSERVRGWGLGGFGGLFGGSLFGGFGVEVFFCEELEGEREAALEFGERVGEFGFGGDEEDAAGVAEGVEALEDEACGDGFAEALFVGDEDARALESGGLNGDVELVGAGGEATVEEAAEGSAEGFEAAVEGAVAEVVDLFFFYLGVEETVVWLAEGEGVAEAAFLDFLATADVGDGAGLIFEAFDGEVFAVLGFEDIADGEFDPSEGWIFDGVDAGSFCGREVDGHPVRFCVDHESETEFWFGLAEPALTRDEASRYGLGLPCGHLRKKWSLIIGGVRGQVWRFLKPPSLEGFVLVISELRCV
jgi:hypothetical protein